MSRIVMKFGGTSVSNVERIRHVADLVEEVAREGHEVVVVVSAMAGDTDRLIRLANEITPDPPEREIDMLLSSGERITSALLAMALTARGRISRSFSGRQVGIHTDSTHTKARIEHIESGRLLSALSAGIIPVVAGFQGISPSEDVTTLGRGGSDTTAVALAVALSADRCDIYTDVTGVFTADPNMVPRARKLERISYEEMLEMAALGAKVLHSRSVEFAMRYRMPLRVLSTFSKDPGTLVTEEDKKMEQMVVSGVTLDRNQAQVVVCDVPDRPGLAASLFRELSDNAVIVDMIVQNVGQDNMTDISFTVPRSEVRKTIRIAREVARRIGAGEVRSREDISKISIVGVGMRSHSGVAARMFETLAAEGINILMISTSEIKISCLIDEKYGELAARVVHQSFGLDRADSGEPVRG
ncbi:MAG: aspartate kinase [Nitrospirae bacterium]|nr:aspartate kinase [Nitrospirota bacterium]MCL5285454.1 aspartate kinase [Nitrospirota bacterium]